MAEKDLESEKLELSLFGRKRRKGGKKSADDDGATAAAPPADDRPEPAAAPPEPVIPEATAPPEPETEPEPVTEREPVSADPDPGRSDDTAVLPPTGATPGAPAAEPGQPGRRARGGARVARKTRGSSPASSASTTPAKSKSRRTPVRTPSMAATTAALAVGAVVGLAAVAMTYASLKACDLIAGTDSCGGPGLFVLLAVVVVMILGGQAALSMLGVPEAGGISFLGVAMFVAVCLVVLLPNLLELWMVLVAPVLCALTYLAAHWIVTRFDEDVLETEGPPQYDVR